MKQASTHILVLFLLVAAHVLKAHAQEQGEPTACPDYFMKAADAHFQGGEYQLALYNYRAIRTCGSFSKDKVKARIEKTETCLDLKNQAEEAFYANEHADAIQLYKKILKYNANDDFVRKRIYDCKIFAAPIPDNMVLVKGGRAVLGSDTYNSERPVHEVALSSFYITKTEVTNEVYAEFLNEYQSDTVREGPYSGEVMFLQDERGVQQVDGEWQAAEGFEKYPVIYVSWYGANEFCKWKNARLPTEAEWEYAARGGLDGKETSYSGSNDIKEVAWFYDNSGKKTHKVGTKAPNEIGVYDMSGNVYEWVADWYDSYTAAFTSDPQGPPASGYKCIRGGSWYDFPSHLRITNRGNYSPDYLSNTVGFRYVKTP